MGSNKSKAQSLPNPCKEEGGDVQCGKIKHGTGKCIIAKDRVDYTCECHKPYTAVGINTKAKCIRDMCHCGTGSKSMMLPFGETDFEGTGDGLDNINFGGYIDGSTDGGGGAQEENYNARNNDGNNHEVVWGLGGFILALTLVMCFQFAKYVIKRRKVKVDKAGCLLSKGEPDKIRPDVDASGMPAGEAALLSKNESEHTTVEKGTV